MAYHILHYDLLEIDWSTDILTFQYLYWWVARIPLSLDMGSVKYITVSIPILVLIHTLRGEKAKIEIEHKEK